MRNQRFQTLYKLNKITILREFLIKNNIDLTEHQINLIFNILDLSKHHYIEVFHNKEDFYSSLNNINLINEETQDIEIKTNTKIQLYKKQIDNVEIIVSLKADFYIKRTIEEEIKDGVELTLYIGQWEV